MPDPDSHIAHATYRIVGTAGHIDHGKSTLVRALSGTDPDRLREEKERGITIDLGFADAVIDDVHVGFVDVPGHERFVKNMLAGVGGIDAVLMVVAADESVMPQTREHFAICRLLGVRHGVVAITKCDLVDSEIADLVELEIAELLEGSPLVGAPIVRTSSHDEASLATLAKTIARTVAAVPPRGDRDTMRLPVDRAFTMRGFGTVVTGTLLAGTIAVGDSLETLPEGRPVTVRGIQVHGRVTERATAGQRVAVNLHGVQLDEIDRGMVLAFPGALVPASMLDVRVETLPEFELRNGQRIRFHHGAAEILGRVVLLSGGGEERRRLAPGTSGFAQLRLESPYPAIPGDRAILRRYSPLVTLGGAIVLDTQPAKRRAGSGATRALTMLLEADDPGRLRAWARDGANHGAAIASLRARLGRTAAVFETAIGDATADGAFFLTDGSAPRLVSEDVRIGLAGRILAAVAQHHAAHSLEAGLDKERLRSEVSAGYADVVFDATLNHLFAADKVRLDGALVALPDHRIELDAESQSTYAAILAGFAAGKLAPPPVDVVLAAAPDARTGQQMLRLAFSRGDLVRVTDRYVITTAAFDDLVVDLRRTADSDGFTVGDFKTWTGVSRKHAIPLLEFLDLRRVTRRSGDRRFLA